MKRILGRLAVALVVCGPMAHADPATAASGDFVTIDHDPCFGTCPAFSVTVYGDGRVTYEGRGYIDVIGDFHYAVPPAEVAALVGRLKARRLWSMKERYAVDVQDLNATVMTLAIEGRRKTIVDYGGAGAGMPQGVSESEADIDAVARDGDWTVLSMAGLERLKTTGFDFKSRAGGDLLFRATASQKPHDENVLLALLDLDAPTTGGELPPPPIPVGGPPAFASANLLAAATGNHYEAVSRRLIDIWATAMPNQISIDQAFDDAIRAGDLQIVRQIWPYHPGPACIDRHRDWLVAHGFEIKQP